MTDNELPSDQAQPVEPQSLQPSRPAVRTVQVPGERKRPPSSTTETTVPPPMPPTDQEGTPSGGSGFSEWSRSSYHRLREYFNRSPRLRRTVYQGRFAPAFWTVASVISLLINVILIAVILILGRQLFNLRTIISEGLVGGLYENFVKMDQAHILTNVNVNSTIQVQDKIAVVFDLPLNQDTEVVLTEATAINGATIFLNGAAVPLNIILPTGTALNIGMDMVVPVSTTVPVSLDVPVNLSVPVDIPLEQTQLHEPFVGLQSVVEPYHNILSNTPSSWEQIEGCSHWYSRWLCRFIFGEN